MRIAPLLVRTALLAIGVAAPDPAGAQTPETRLPTDTAVAASIAASPLEPRLAGGLTLALANPVGDFRRYAELGPGFGGFVRYHPSIANSFAWRVDLTMVNYGRDTQHERVDVPGYGRLDLEVTTGNDIYALLVGPELAARRGAVRPYVGVGVGLAHVRTGTSASIEDEFEEPIELDDRTRLSDWSYGYGASAGVNIPLGRKLDAVLLELGVSYLGTGTVRYMGRDRLAPDDPDALVGPFEGKTEVLGVRLGVIVR